MADKDHSDVYTESASPDRKKPGFGSRLKTHLKKWWWLYLIILACVVLIIVLPLIYVGFPNIAQKGVNESTLEIKSMQLTNPTSTSFRLQQEEVLRSDSKYHPQLDSFNASLFLESTLPDIKPFAYVQVPAVKSTGEVSFTLDQVVEIADLEQFTEYTKLVVDSEEYRLAIRGRPVLHQGSFPETTVDYNEVVTLKGLNKLAGFDVQEFEIKLRPEPDGANMVGKVFIPNPTIMTIEMGNVTLNLYIEGEFIGTSLIQDLTLRPGDNVVDMRSTTDRLIVLEKLGQFEDGILPVDVIGNSSIYNGQHLTYYEDALSANTQRIMLDVGGALGG
ncbi:MAG: hypothetical protein M1817_004937 [Caeruleum heppii]|nr:MAG: hypothetical protein M1817_004937 [Caeruleum heppii]